jgi:hypothetical protein
VAGDRNKRTAGKPTVAIVSSWRAAVALTGATEVGFRLAMTQSSMISTHSKPDGVWPIG